MESPYHFFSLFAMLTLMLCIRSSKGNVGHDLKIFELPLNITGPESIAFDCNGEGPYTGVSDGRILKWGGAHVGWTEFAVTSPIRKREVCDGSIDINNEAICGRPLGLKFHETTCDLYIADAYFGLLVVGPKGGLATQLASSAGGVPFRFLNGLDIDESCGFVYFTDSSAVYSKREVLTLLQSGDKSGRLMKYDIKHKKVTILVKNLQFANGVALSQNKDFLLYSQTNTRTVSKYWLKGPKYHTSKILAKLDGTPDNIVRTENGHFWIAIGSKMVVGVKVDGEGKTLEVLSAMVGKIVLENVSEVRERNGSLWIGSFAMPFLGLLRCA